MGETVSFEKHTTLRRGVSSFTCLSLSFSLFSSLLLRFLCVSREKRNWDFLILRPFSGGGWCIFVGLSAYKGPSYLLLFQSSDFYTKRFWFWVGERRMEGNKQKGTSCSFTSELFGSKESHLSSSSSGIFGSIFSPSSSKVLGRESLRNELNGKIANESWTSKIGIQDNFSKGNDSKTKDAVNKDMSSIYQHQRVQPCHLSSSIYYGGQDIYFNPQSPQNEGYFSSLHKNDGEDDSEIASRGDWWQGSLYY